MPCEASQPAVSLQVKTVAPVRLAISTRVADVVAVAVGEEYRVDVGEVRGFGGRERVARKERVDEGFEPRPLDVEGAVSKITKFRHFDFTSIPLYLFRAFLKAIINYTAPREQARARCGSAAAVSLCREAARLPLRPRCAGMKKDGGRKGLPSFVA